MGSLYKVFNSVLSPLYETKQLPYSHFRLILLGIVVVIIVTVMFFLRRCVTKSNRQIKHRIRTLAKEVDEITPSEFFKIRNERVVGKKNKISTAETFSGVYILYNKSKDMYYVGQARDIFQRVNNHFTGHGNGNVYADYKYGDKFTIRLINLKGSGFKSLNELERNAIMTYDCVGKQGYNRTKGNKG